MWVRANPPLGIRSGMDIWVIAKRERSKRTTNRFATGVLGHPESAVAASSMPFQPRSSNRLPGWIACTGHLLSSESDRIHRHPGRNVNRWVHPGSSLPHRVTDMRLIAEAGVEHPGALRLTPG